MSRVMLLRPGSGYGDACFITRLPRILAEKGHTVDVACEKAVRPVFQNNPFINRFVNVPAVAVWKEYGKKTKLYDHVYHTHGHCEVKFMYRTDVQWGSVPNAIQRREKAKGKSYQDEIFKGIGLMRQAGLPEFFFSAKEQKGIWKLRDMLNRDKKKLVLWQWNGSSQSKDMIFGSQYLRNTMEMFPDTVHYVFTNDTKLAVQIPKDNRVFDAMNKISARESIQLCSIADLVIGPESFLINAAGAFDTPKIAFMSHSAPENLTKYFKNCTCIEPTEEVSCYPCYLIQINFQGVYDPVRRGVCREFERNCRLWNRNFVYESLGYKCCYHLPHDKVMQSISEALSG